MKQRSDRQADRIRQRRARETQNLFTRMPAAYAASRQQAQRLLQRAAGLSVVEWRVLWDLHEAGPMTIRDLADIQRTDHSQISRALPDMRRKDLVSLDRDTVDRRQMVVRLTPAGQAAYARAAPVMQRRRAALHTAFSDTELASFIGLLDRFEDFLDQPIDPLLNPERTP